MCHSHKEIQKWFKWHKGEEIRIMHVHQIFSLLQVKEGRCFQTVNQTRTTRFFAMLWLNHGGLFFPGFLLGFGVMQTVLNSDVMRSVVRMRLQQAGGWRMNNKRLKEWQECGRSGLRMNSSRVDRDVCVVLLSTAHKRIATFVTE